MNDLRKAAEMALEVLLDPKTRADEVAEAVKVIRQALAQPKQESLGGEWVPCVKLPVIVHVRNQRKGETHISTREGITPVLPDDLIMRGVAGEEYPIGRELFERTYTFDTAPPKREWVGLTDEEVDALADEHLVAVQEYIGMGEYISSIDGEVEFARAIEAKLKEKNA